MTWYLRATRPLGKCRELAGLVGHQRVPASATDVYLLGEYCN